MKALTVGVTIGSAADASEIALWSSGIRQNIVFLALLLARLPIIAECYFVGDPECGEAHMLRLITGTRTVALDDALATVDVLIEIGLRPEAPALHRFRARGGKLISYMAGNALAMNFEAVASGLDYGEILSEVPFDAVWITPQHWHMNRSYAEITRSDNVQQSAHIWHPILLQRSLANSGVPGFFWKRPPDKEGWRLGVFDPNVNVLKTFHLPLLVAEQAYRQRPELVRRVSLFSAARLIGTPHFEEFCAATDLGRAGRIFAENRFPVAQLLGMHIDAVVTHQWENALNYLYWDVLYSGRPLVHNVSALADIGGYYPSFDPEEGGRVLADALDSHSAEWDRRRPAVLEHLWQYHIDNPKVQQHHAALLSQVMDCRI